MFQSLTLADMLNSMLRQVYHLCDGCNELVVLMYGREGITASSPFSLVRVDLICAYACACGGISGGVEGWRVRVLRVRAGVDATYIIM